MIRRIVAAELDGAGWTGLTAEAAGLFGRLVAAGAALAWLTPPPVDEVADLLRTVVAAGDRDSGLVAGWLDGSLAGLGWWRRHQRPTWRRNASLERVAVAPEAQGRGVGRRLVAELMATAAAAGVETLTLDMRGDNTRAGRLYEALGFREYGRLTGFVAVGERRYDSVFYACPLSSPPDGG